MQRRGLTKEQKRVIRENPHLQPSKIAKFLGLSVNTVKYYRRDIFTWVYSGIGFPFCDFDSCNAQWLVRKNHALIAKTSIINKAINFLDHLIWCIENNMFNQPRIEHPYLENLKFGE